MRFLFHQLRRLGLLAVLVVSVVVISSGDAMAEVIPAGYDYYIIQSSSTLILPPGQIPADFFGPSSQPLDVTVSIQGDTIVERKSDATLPTGTIPIEIVSLELVSCEPITVTFDGPTFQEWDLSIELPGPGDEPPLPQEELTATKTHTNGGTFDSTFNVQPIFTFTKVGDPSDVRVLSFYAEGIPAFNLASVGEDWSNQNPNGVPINASNFYPGGTPGDQSIALQTIDLDGGSLELDLLYVPEPATLSLLAIGGLALIRRRR